MHFLHSRRPPVLHRDLKAVNCFVDKDWCALVGDFGMSREVLNATTQTMAASAAGGNPLWMAPELLQSEPDSETNTVLTRRRDDTSRIQCTPATDVYAFGMLLYELLVWDRPWRRTSLFAIRHQVLSGKRPEIPPVTQLPGVREDNLAFELSGGLQSYLNLMQSCWDQKPGARPSFGMIYAKLKMMLDSEMQRRGLPMEDED